MDRVFEEEKQNLKDAVKVINKKSSQLSETVKTINRDISKLSSVDYQDRYRLIERRNNINKDIDQLSEWNAEKKDGIYFRKIIRYDVDSVLAYARTLDQMKSGLEDIGYVVDLTGKHWTLKHPQSQRKFRFYKLARDGRYDEDHIMERINNNYLFPMQPVKDIVPCKEYRGDHTKLKGIKALYIRYCFELGIIRPKGKRQKYPSPQLRKDLIYMDKITNENTFVGKHNLETIEDVLAFKVSLNKEIESWMNQRRSIYNKIKRTRDPNLKKQLEMDRDTLTSKIAHGKKEIKICEDIEKRVPDIQDKLKMVNALEDERIQTQKEYERSLNL